MSWTKGQFVEKAFSKLGYADYTYDLDPDIINDALLDLDAMMAEWDGIGIRIGYPLTSEPEESTLATETNVPDYANRTIYLNLAKIIGPDLGKELSPRHAQIARAGYLSLLNKAAKPREMSLPGTMPRGAGQKYWRYTGSNFVDDPRLDPALATGDDGVFDFK